MAHSPAPKTLLAYFRDTLGSVLGAGRGSGHDLRAARPFSFLVPGRRIGVVMSMQPRPWPGVSADTARVARKAFRKGSLAMRARDELGSWYDDEAFAEAYGTRGKPGISPAQLAMVTVLQFAENLSDRQAADAVRG